MSCYVSTNIYGICCVCGVCADDEHHSHIVDNKFYCAGCCVFHSGKPKEWGDQHPVTGEQPSLF